jgi:predicted MPP superfamily phosphohydrolase
VAAILIVFWIFTAASIGLGLSGVVYYSHLVPVEAASLISAVGSFWTMGSVVVLIIGAPAWILISKFSAPHSAGRRNCLRVAGGLALGAPVALLGLGASSNRKRFGVKELDFPVPGLHPDLEGFRIVQVSDLHVSPFLSVQDAGRVIDMANELKADLALFTGDLISELDDPLDAAIRELVRLRGDYGVLGCMGNHEFYVKCLNYLERKARLGGVDFLRSRATQIRRGQAVLNIAGVDHQASSTPGGYLKGAQKLLVPGMPNLLLSHNPDVFPRAAALGFQAVLSGHTHGGQVNVEILHQNVNPARFRTRFTSGLYRLDAPAHVPFRGQASCFVTNGIGTIRLPVRLGAPPEIALLRLRQA